MGKVKDTKQQKVYVSLKSKFSGSVLFVKLRCCLRKLVRYRGEIMQALGLGAQYGIVLPFSRSHESEADIIGLDLMAKAGFDPKESVALWQNMSKAGSGATPEFMSTHPAPGNRIKELQAKMPEALNAQMSARSKGKNPQCKL